MFILRRYSSDGMQINQEIGDCYTLIEREINYEEFSKTFKSVFGKNHVADLDESSDDDTKNCYAFIIGSSIQPLYKSQRNYIMSSSGKTFDNLSFK